ncbi:hypothetical protein [Escherichia coli]|uniref:hypothetical protein n=1 Tax=Escherichia coli TaxID=562 RepID=UPI0032B49BC9
MARQKKEMLALQNEHFRLQVDLSGSRLTAKEKDVIGLLLAGHGVKAISIMRNRSLKTVSSQKQNAPVQSRDADAGVAAPGLWMNTGNESEVDGRMS